MYEVRTIAGDLGFSLIIRLLLLSVSEMETMGEPKFNVAMLSILADIMALDVIES